MIPVTKPFLPPKEEYEALIEDVWKRNWLTNNGPLVQEFEKKMVDYLGIANFKFVSNGTIALQISLKALNIKGEVITTPFSYVATTSSIVWENCKPVFADIAPQTLNIDAAAIEALITPNTSAIVATHVYGNPCDIETIRAIADKHHLKVIYDAAHCFGTTYKGKSVYAYGDVSTASFHATKLFHTIEGGGIMTNNSKLDHKLDRLRNFGHAGPGKFEGAGINGKNSEFHAAMGLANIKYAGEILKRRRLLSQKYNELLEGLEITRPKIQDHTTYNFAYYPILLETEKKLLALQAEFKNNAVGGRRYFYPLLSDLEYVEKQSTPVAEDISKRIFCLPLYHSLQSADIEYISNLTKKILR